MGRTARIGTWALRRCVAALLFVVLAGSVSANADAQRRVALVIGNGAYANVPRLPNPPADAAGVAQALGDVGFEVVQGIDLPRAELLERIRVFANQSIRADIALVYYAGHGVQVDNENWILPVDAHLKDKFSLEFEAISLSSVIKITSAAVSRVLILDACRNNPFADQLRSNARAVVERGLARVNVTDNGILIAFATSPGNISVDSATGAEDHSPFAKALIENIRTPGLEVRQLFTRIRQHVYNVTGGAQVPWENSSLLNDVFLAGEAQPVVSALEAEYVDWQKLETSTDLKTLEEYLKRYPGGKFTPLARLRINSLRQPAQSTAAPAAAIRDCGNCPEMIAIPAGSFMLGASANDTEKNENEGPVKRADVAGFALGKFTVTFAEWDACVAAAGCTARPEDAGWGRGKRPVINVTYEDANQYIAWLTRVTGKKYRLPTETEWEYAARGGGDGPRYWKGSARDACRYANVYDTTAAKGVQLSWRAHDCSDGVVFTAPVGSYLPNGFGLYDMIGNVWQWTADCWRARYDTAAAQVAGPQDAAACGVRALRGGSWMSDPANARVSNRMRNEASDKDINIGFRVMRDLD